MTKQKLCSRHKQDIINDSNKKNGLTCHAKLDSLVKLGFISIALENKKDLVNIIEELESNVNNFDKNISYLEKKIPYKFLEDELFNTTSNYFILKAEMSKYLDQPHAIIEEYYSEAIEKSVTNDHKKNIYFN